jgi:nucleoside-diphosphate-sugar epimerase
MKALILGGTGSIGAAVLGCLLDRGHEVMALGRSQASIDALRNAGATPVAGDICTPESWVHVVNAVDCVIHAAAVWDDDMGAVDRHLVDTLLSAMQQSPEPRRFIYTGGCWQYGETGDAVATEDTPFDSIASFAWANTPIRRVLEAEDVCGMVIHPAMVYERDGGVFSGMVADAKRLLYVRVIGGEHVRWPLVHKDDLALAYALMMEKGKQGDTYNISTVDGLSVGTIARAIAKRFNADPDPVFRTVASAQAEFGSWAEGYALDQQMSGEKARTDLGWNPQHTDVLADIS